MKAFLLTAGLGMRLRPLTNDLPKCLLPICGKPLLEIWIDLLGFHGIGEVLVNTHWRHEKIEEYIEDRKRRSDVRRLKKEKSGKRKEEPDVRLFYEPELLGSAGTLLANRDWVADGQAFFILYGDNLTNVDLGKMRAFHEEHDFPFTLGVFKADEPKRSGIVELDENGVIIGFEEKPEEPKSDMAAAGVYIADERIFEFFPGGAESSRMLDLGLSVIPRLVGHMKAYFIEEFLMDIGTPDSYEKAQILWPQIHTD
jgi:mannose-1-phosphate guanylyltransferase